MDNEQSNNITILINNYVNVNNDSSSNSDNTDNNDTSDNSDNSDNIDINNNNLSSSDNECNDDEICVICLEKTDKNDSIKACNCANSYHIKCLLTWIIYKDNFECEICKTMYNIPNKFIVKHYNEIENIKKESDNRRNIRYRRNAIMEQYIDDEIIPIQRSPREIMCYIGLSFILISLFTTGVVLFIKINT